MIAGKEPIAQTVDSLIVEELVFEEVRGDKGCKLPWHDHPATYLDLYLDGATCASWQPIIQPRMVSILPAGLVHRSTSLTEFHTLQVIIPDSWFSRSRQGLPRDSKVFDVSRPAQIVSQIYQSFLVRDDLSSSTLQELLLDFWASTSPSTLSKGAIKEMGWINRSEEYLQAHYAASISPHAIAAEIGVDPAHLMREFRRHYRCTMGERVRSIRVEKACHLLKSSRISLSEVAHQVGFADQSHFNRGFKVQLGVTPSAYLRSLDIKSESSKSDSDALRRYH